MHLPVPAVAIALSTLLLACETPAPQFVSKADLDRAHTLNDVRAICVGLTMKDDDTREYAALKLKDYKDEGASCLCQHLTRDGTWDPAVLSGLANATDDHRVGCVADALDDATLKDRAGLAKAMLKVKAPKVHARLVVAANSDTDPEVQAAALPALRGTRDPKEQEMLISGLKRGGAWGANAAMDLAGNPAATEALRDAVKTGDPPTKAAALVAYRDLKLEDFPDVACGAMADADPGVRVAAIRAVDVFRNPKILACLRDHVMTVEPDVNVRTALLEVLDKNAAPEASQILCDAIPFWVKTYVTDTAPTLQSDLDIVYYQNDRDYERSLECATAAFNKGGYTECGKAYLGARVNEFGGKVHYKACPASTPPAGGGSGGVVEF